MSRAEGPISPCLNAVIARQADLVARWMLVGFIHGVMNTDNCRSAGETIDYGPCAFMDAYDPARSSARSTRRPLRLCQPAADRAMEFARLAECLLPLFSDDKDKAVDDAKAALGGFADASTPPI